MTDRETAAALDAIYAELPTVRCRRRCQEYCAPVVGAGALMVAERDRIAARSGGVVPPPDRLTGRCGYLDAAGLCAVYDRRPLICRLFGVAEGLLCPHGCEPERVLSRAEVTDLMRRMVAVGGGAARVIPVNAFLDKSR